MATRRGRRLVLAAAGAAAVALVVLLAVRFPAASDADSVVAGPRRADAVVESPPAAADGPDRRPVRRAPEVATTGAPATAEDPPPPSIAGRATLLDGTPLGRRIVVATGTAAGPLSARSALTAEDGSFAIEVAEPCLHRLRLNEGANLPGGTREDVLAPARDVELRLDALLLRPAVDATGAASLVDESYLRISAFDADPPRQPSVSRWARGSFGESLLPTGPGYLLEVDRPRDRPLVAFLEPGLPSGVVDVLLQERDPALGSVHVVLVGPELQPPNRVAVELCGQAQRTFVVVLAPDREGWSRPLLPGGFGVSARVTGAPPFDWTMAEATVDEVDIPAGGDREVEVRLYPAGMVTVAVSTSGPPEDGEAPHVSLATCEQGASAWRLLGVSAEDSPQRRVAWSLAPGSTYVVEELFLPGPRRLRVQATGWRTVEVVLDVQVGRESTWNVVLEPAEDRAAPTGPPRARAPRR